MKFWIARYQVSVEGRTENLYFEAESLREACLAFDRFFKAMQANDRWFKEQDPTIEPYWGTLLAVRIRGWEPSSIREDGQLGPGSTGMAGDRGFEWKIDNPGLPYLTWVEART